MLKRGFKATLKTLDKFVDSQTPGQLFKKHPLFKGKSVASRAGERIMADLIDYTQQPAGRFQYVMLAIDVFSRHVWGKPMATKTGVAITETFKALAADIGPMKQVNGDVEFEQSRPLQTWLNNNILVRAKKNVQDLAILEQQYGAPKEADCQLSAAKQHGRLGSTPAKGPQGTQQERPPIAHERNARRSLS